MFQAEAGGGKTASVKSKRDAIRYTVAAMSYLVNSK
jgi:hypothetical protein